MIDPINDGDQITPGKSLDPTGKPITPGQAPAGFESYMKEPGQSKLPPGTPQAAGPTPMNIAQGPQISTAGLSMNSILAQAQTTQDSLGTVGEQLQNPKLKLKRSQSHLVRQKLGDANSYIRAAGSKLGVNTPEAKMPPGVGGISRFLAMVNDGQDQLVAVQEKLKKMAANNEQLNPGEMLAVQVKMGLAQQEISYTSTLLGKVVQSITQIINTQL